MTCATTVRRKAIGLTSAETEDDLPPTAGIEEDATLLQDLDQKIKVIDSTGEEIAGHTHLADRGHPMTRGLRI